MAILSPQPRLRFFDSAGNPWSGAKLYTYQSGTSTLLATTDSAGSANTNPVVADADGYMDVRLSAASYKLVLTAPDGDPASPVWTVDNVDGAFLSLVATSDQTLSSGIILPNGKTISWVAGASVTGATDGELSLNVPTGETVNLQVNGVTKATVSGTGLTVTGAFVSQVATGTAPLTVTSTTPVPNLTTVPITYNSAGAQQVNTKIVSDITALTAGSATVTLTGAAVFTGSTTYQVIAVDVTAANAVQIVKTSGSQFTITGTGGDIIGWIAIGN